MRIIRESTYADMDALLSIFEKARATIATLGIDQWQNGYPSAEVIEGDIERGESFVVEENGSVVATFVILKTEEPTYRNIYEGEWLTGKDGSYTAVHRFTITPDARGRGIAAEMLNFAACKALAAGKRSLRIDTHEGNAVMRRMLEKNGFQYTGIVYLENGDARVGYEKILSPTLCHFEDQPCAFLQNLIEDDITYSVLHRILTTNCKHIFTNYKDIIICHSEDPYPVWVYCPDEKEENAEVVGSVIKSCFSLNAHNVILPQTLLGRLREIDPYFADAGVKMELFTYRLDALLPLEGQGSGRLEVATLEDLALLSLYRQRMSYEMEGFEFSLEECSKKIRKSIEDSRLYVWRVGGKIVSTATLEVGSPYARIGGVYTTPESRRRGYAIRLVRALCAKALSEGMTPILYTDGAYAASNGCYIKIGFQKVSTLVNIGRH